MNNETQTDMVAQRMSLMKLSTNKLLSSAVSWLTASF